MAASLKNPQKMKLDYNVDRETYNDFVRACSAKGYAPQVVMEKIMKKYVETGAM